MSPFFSLKAALQKRKDINLVHVKEAYDFAEKAHKGQMRKSGEEYITHPVAVAIILLDLGADEESLIAALLHDTVEDTEVNLEEIEQRFGKRVAKLVDSVTKVGKISHFSSLKDMKAANLQKIFTGALKNERAILIKIADRAHNIETIGTFPLQKRQRIAQETMEIYHPLAKIFGIWKIKGIFEHHCFSLLEKERYRFFSHKVSKFKKENLPLTEERREEIQKVLATHFKTFEVKSTFQTPFEVLESSQRSGYSDDDDRFCWRLDVLVPSMSDCYKVLGTLHQQFSVHQRGFSDFISAPKANGYQAIHTSIFCKNTLLSLHIKTYDMELANEKCPFFLFPKLFPRESFQVSLQSISTTSRYADLYLHDIHKNLLKKNILIANSEGETLFLPEGATALDAIFLFFPDKAIYTQTIWVNNAETSFDHPLGDGDIVRAHFFSQKQVSFEWGSFLQVTAARNTFYTNIHKKGQSEKISIGKQILQDEFDRYGKGDILSLLSGNIDLFASFSVRDENEIFLLVAEGLLPSFRVLERIDAGRHIDQKKKKWGFLGIKKKGSAKKKTDLSLRIFFRKSDQHTFSEDLFSLAQKKSLVVQRASFSFSKKQGIAMVLVSSLKKKNLDRFFLELSVLSSVIKIQPLPPLFVRIGLLGALFFSLFSWIVFGESLLISFSYQYLFVGIGILLVLLSHSFLYRFIARFFPRFRPNPFFALSFFFLNAFALLLFAAFLVTDHITLSFFLPLVLLVLFSILLTFLFFRGQTLTEKKRGKLSLSSWKDHQHKKMVGYLIRLGAVVIWGIQPLYIKYTLTNTVDPSLRVFFTAAGAMLLSSLIFSLFALLHRKKEKKSDKKEEKTLTKEGVGKLPINALFFTIVISEILFNYLMNSSLVYTSGTSFILLNNFSPILALAIAAILWRDKIPYLRDSKTAMMIFITFLVGSIGSTLLFYNDIKFASIEHVFGDSIAVLAMAMDVLLVTCQIQYAKYLSRNQSAEMVFKVFFWVTIFALPLVFLKWDIFSELTTAQVLFCLGAGAISGLGKVLNYEAFRRIDGFLAFLMFNISIFLTFSLEAFFLKEIPPTFLLLVGGGLIVGASIFAEKINTKCEKKALLNLQ